MDQQLRIEELQSQIATVQTKLHDEKEKLKKERSRVSGYKSLDKVWIRRQEQRILSLKTQWHEIHTELVALKPKKVRPQIDFLMDVIRERFGEKVAGEIWKQAAIAAADYEKNLALQEEALREQENTINDWFPHAIRSKNR
jgi:hypothetical protein